jgi:NAD+ kinase
MRKVERIGIVIKPHAPGIVEILNDLLDYFEKKKIQYVLEEVAADILEKNEGMPREKIPNSVDMIMVFGGDGTLLSIAYKAAQENVPVMGVNLGSLGFLTEVPQEEMYLTLDSFLQGNDKIVSPRQILEILKEDKVYYCLNDVVINKGALARMILYDIHVDGKEVANIRADGLIISTPTGSTAYALSAGGPIMHPYIPAVVIAPICPHTLSIRPMVVSSHSKIEIRLISENEEVYFTLDGQRGGLMKRDEILEVKRSQYFLPLISSPKRNYFDLLREKLGWG